MAQALAAVETRRGTPELVALLDAAARAGTAHTLGLTGPPGVGKSTLTNALVQRARAAGLRVAVLAVDPSSRRTGGALLGDRARMKTDPEDRDVFVRSMAARDRLGGLSDDAVAAMVLLRAAYDLVIVETVGVGQSETTVADMVDFFLVLLLAGGGDDLQGIKKGIIEIADMIAINKADGDNVTRAEAAATEYRSALSILTPQSASWTPPVVTISGRTNIGLDTLWAKIEEHRTRTGATGEFAERRRAQALSWMHDMLEDRLMEALRSNPRVASSLPGLEADVREGRLLPTIAVDRILEMMGLGAV